MPGSHSIRAFHPQSPAIREIADVCANESDYGAERRADANETAIVAGALQAVALDALRNVYPGIMFRRLAPQQDGLTPGTETYRWDELDVRGMAKIIANYADDLPDVSESTTQNVGIVRSIGASFQYSKQDIRWVLEARRNGRQNVVLDVNKVDLCREVIERKKDQIAAYGDTMAKLPGILKNVNVTLLTASAPATGTNRRWTGADKTPAEILADLRALTRQVRLQSKGIHTPDTLLVPVEEYEILANTPILVGQNETTILAQFMAGQGGINRAMEVLPWDRASTADAAGTGPRVLAYQRDPSVVRIVEPLDFEPDAPQRVNLSFKIPCEARFGGIYFRRPLAAAYMDFV